MSRPSASPPSSPVVPGSTFDAIVRGEHGDPFSLLGPHPVDDAIVLRALAPGAVAMRARVGRRVVPLVRVHDGGLFAARIEPAQSAPIDAATGRLRYRLEITDGDGHVFVRDDPYRFGPVLAEDELARLATGEHLRRGEALGAHLARHQGAKGVRFAVWAPSARRVSVVGAFNGWRGATLPMRPRGMTGIWELFVPGLGDGEYYKYEVLPQRGPAFMKTDPAACSAPGVSAWARRRRSGPPPSSHCAKITARQPPAAAPATLASTSTVEGMRAGRKLCADSSSNDSSAPVAVAMTSAASGERRLMSASAHSRP